MGIDNFNRSHSTQFSTLERRVVHVEDRTIRNKWKKLPSSSHAATREIIISAKTQARGGRSLKKVDAASEACVDEVASRLIDHLPRLPLPPTTIETHFDLEANLQRMKRAEEQLTTTQNSMNLLRAQIEKEKSLLRQDEREYKQLEASLKSNETYRREQNRTLHPSVRNMGAEDDLDLLSIHLKEQRSKDTSKQTFENDPELASMLSQLQNHLNSMQSNTSDMVEIKKAISGTMADLAVYKASISHSSEATEVG